MPVAAVQEVFREGPVKEPGLVRNDIVEDGNHLAGWFQVPGNVAQGGPEPGHPPTDQHDIGLPVPDGLPGGTPGKRIRRIQESGALHGYGFVLGCYCLALAREQERRILSREIERFDKVLLAQFFQRGRIELCDSSSKGVETGQQCDFQDYSAFSAGVLLLALFLTYSAFRPAMRSSVISRLGSPATTGAGRMSPWVAMMTAYSFSTL